MFKNLNKETLSHTTLVIGMGIIILTSMAMVIMGLTSSIIIIIFIITTTVRIERSKLHDEHLKKRSKTKARTVTPGFICEYISASVTFSPFLYRGKQASEDKPVYSPDHDAE